MELISRNIQIISAPSILGLKPSGVEKLSESLIASGLSGVLRTQNEIVHIETLNAHYSGTRDVDTSVLNPLPIRDFSLSLALVVSETFDKNLFPFVLGGDCSILIGALSALKAKGNFGLVFLDAHADFYEPEKSITGEVADMDLAIVTGRGPELLTNINGLKPYVEDKNVIHIGQRDWEETRRYESQDIRKTAIKSFSLNEIKTRGIVNTTNQMLRYLAELEIEDFWLHYDTDVLSDEINPAVDYRIPGGLEFEEVEYVIRSLLRTNRMAGVSVTIFNPALDETGDISKNIVNSLGKAFNLDLS